MGRKTVFKIYVFAGIIFISLVLHITTRFTFRDRFTMSFMKTVNKFKQKENLHTQVIDSQMYAYSVTGKEFDFKESTLITAQTILKNQTFVKKPVTMENKATFPRLVPVTAISSSHFRESIDHIWRLPRVFGHVKLVLYDLGLSSAEAEAISKISFVEYRKFNFLKYPPHIANLFNYAWKILIIQETLAEFEAVMWMDSSIVLTGTYLPAIVQMVKEKSGFLFFNDHGSNRMISASHPKMLDYLPVVRTSAMRSNYMQQAGGMIIFNTLEVQRDVMKWAVLCALCKNCIAPLEAKLECPEHLIGIADFFIDCHRYDQAIFNVLVANANKFKPNKYVYSGKPFSKIIKY